MSHPEQLACLAEDEALLTRLGRVRKGEQRDEVREQDGAERRERHDDGDRQLSHEPAGTSSHFHSCGDEFGEIGKSIFQ